MVETQSSESGSGTRRQTHIIGALFAAAVLLTFLLMAPMCGRYFHGRQINAIQTGALTDLQLIADAQADFFGKHHTYTTDLKILGVFPKKVVYKFGFVTASDPSLVSDPSHDPSRKDLDALKKSDPAIKIEYSPVTKLDQIEFSRLNSYCPDCTATKSSFKAVAAANLDEDAVLDVWSVNEKGEITHLVNDLSQ